jgi:hypothetical protein
MNRKQRRHPERIDEQPRPDDPSPAKVADMQRQGPPDTLHVRAKSTGHGKKTADKWNQ